MAGEGPTVPGLPRRQILSSGDPSLQASHETGQSLAVPTPILMSVALFCYTVHNGAPIILDIICIYRRGCMDKYVLLPPRFSYSGITWSYVDCDLLNYV